MKPAEIAFKEWKEDYNEFEEITARFYRNEISQNEYKGFSGGYGSYAQRGGTCSMLRLRLPGGRVDKDQLRFIAKCVEKYQIDLVHLTTCQTIQLHNLNESSVCAIARAALDHGILTRGGGGDYPRNVMLSPLSGVEKGEYFDVTPYAIAASNYLVGFIKGKKMPRKLKLGFSNSPKNITHATFRDLGFAARPDRTFDVYSAGGLGNKPKFGVKIAEGVEPCDILYYIKAMYQTFLTYGNYDSRTKARTRFMQDSLGGPQQYRKAFLEILQQVRDSGEDLKLEIDELPVTKKGLKSDFQHPRAVSQKQEGLYAVAYHPIGGIPDTSFFGKLYDLIAPMDQVELRLSPDESLYMINCTADEAKQVLAATEDGAATLFQASVACIGASVCQVGVRDSQALMARLVEMERREGFEDGILPQIHISGCPSSCGTHQTGIIGFHGCVKMIEKVPAPAFTLHVGGCEIEKKERMGDIAGVILEQDIPEFLSRIGHAVQESGQTFVQWYEENPDEIIKIAQAYVI